ncbi:7-carboxy-7-deazaguanine synthase [Posidoniimonas polymericola]|uniref:7-carboxy-7-deazaguanine synthase n=1 Tax=Posidoniimonas polymericola TaxID=2528002 RepID=A0A5C5YSE4_9BACT|nr:radical SAM protein [Posidoniimonas polymericola]TWT77828.1 7-carboxy-7-deazaguanine synthase [Posidoniimonas polymericola]
MRIAEIYKSIQGEGLLTGSPSVFVRASGCNLRCWFCDTPHASWSPEGVDLSVDEIVAQIEEWDCRHVVITGGEPMLFAELIPLCEKLRLQRRHITIETAGTLYLPVVCDLMSVSPKLSGSAPNAEEHPHWRRRHEQNRNRPEIVRRLLTQYDYQLKFVVDQRPDLAELEEWLAGIGTVDRERVLLMPQGVREEELAERATWLRPYCHDQGYTYCPRKQIEWFGAVRGT